jgi:choline-glycine betaine transporter
MARAPLGAAAGSVEAARDLAMAATIFHWALHPWAIYTVLALALAFFTYNQDLPLTLRSAFYPLLGDRVWGWWGHIIDIFLVIVFFVTSSDSGSLVIDTITASGKTDAPLHNAYFGAPSKGLSLQHCCLLVAPAR